MKMAGIELMYKAPKGFKKKKVGIKLKKGSFTRKRKGKLKIKVFKKGKMGKLGDLDIF